MYIRLTIVTVETSPNKLVVVCDLVDNSTETAYTVLYNLGSRRNKWHHTQVKLIAAVSHLRWSCSLRAVCKNLL